MERLVGEVITGYKINSDDEILLKLYTKDKIIIFYHDQECCEEVWLETDPEEIKRIIGSPILQAEERTEECEELEEWWERNTYTFYTIRTLKDTLTLRFIGTSNGYYSEDVDIEIMPLSGE